jgi:hypothetical protein
MRIQEEKFLFNYSYTGLSFLCSRLKARTAFSLILINVSEIKQKATTRGPRYKKRKIKLCAGHKTQPPTSGDPWHLQSMPKPMRREVRSLPLQNSTNDVSHYSYQRFICFFLYTL